MAPKGSDINTRDRSSGAETHSGGCMSIQNGKLMTVVRAKNLIACVVLALILAPAGARAEYREGAPQPEPFVITGELLVQFTDDVSMAGMTRSFGRVSSTEASLTAVFERHQVSSIEPLFPWRRETSSDGADRMMSKFQRLKVPLDADLDLLIEELLASGKTLTAEKNWAMPLDAVPDDPRWTIPGQYGPQRIDADQAWDVETGSDAAIIAIADSGVNWKHEDLKSKIWVNPGEDLDGDGEVFDTDDLDGIDNDGNGVVDDLIGYDFFTGLTGGVLLGEDGGAPDPDPNDFNGHGTHVSGIAAAATNNSLGIAGVAGGWNPDGNFSRRGPRIMCLRVGATGQDGNGYINLGNAATAIDYAARMGADVVNCSWGSLAISALSNALNLADDSGVSIAKSAGNDGSDNIDFMGGRPDVMSIASTDGGDSKSGFSNFGDWIEISAPGSSINATFSFQYTPGYANLSGTSMSSPHYSGAVALVKSVMPSWDKTEIDSILMATADNIDAQNPGFVGLLGAGRVNVNNALQSLPLALFSAGPVVMGNPGLTVDFTDLSPNSPTAWSWAFGDGNISSMQNPSNTYNNVGIYDVALEVTEANGQGIEEARRLVFIYADTIGGDTVAGSPGQSVIAPLYLRNDFAVKSIIFPFKYVDANGGKVTFSSFSTSGLRTELWEFQLTTSINPFSSEVVIEMRSNIGIGTNGHSRYLEPGDGPILNLTFNIDPTSAPGAIVPITSGLISGKQLSVETVHGLIVPAYSGMAIEVQGCCQTAGDANHDEKVNIADVTFLIARIFAGGAAPVCNDEADANGDNSVNIADVTYLIARIFAGGSAPVCGNTGN